MRPRRGRYIATLLPAEIRTMECDEHGVTPWLGDIVCAFCGRVYQTTSPKLPHAAKELCMCGERLSPKDDRGQGAFTARAICHQCFERKAEKQTRLT